MVVLLPHVQEQDNTLAPVGKLMLTYLGSSRPACMLTPATTRPDETSQAAGRTARQLGRSSKVGYRRCSLAAVGSFIVMDRCDTPGGPRVCRRRTLPHHPVVRPPLSRRKFSESGGTWCQAAAADGHGPTQDRYLMVTPSWPHNSKRLTRGQRGCLLQLRSPVHHSPPWS
jgi:hypothetical protein